MLTSDAPLESWKQTYKLVHEANCNHSLRLYTGWKLSYTFAGGQDCCVLHVCTQGNKVGPEWTRMPSCPHMHIQIFVGQAPLHKCCCSCKLVGTPTWKAVHIKLVQQLVPQRSLKRILMLLLAVRLQVTIHT